MHRDGRTRRSSWSEFRPAAVTNPSRRSRGLLARLRKSALGGGAVLTAAVATAPPASAYPLPGRVTGDISVHDPSAVKRPNGSYLVAHTGTGIALKTSTDRIAFRNAGSVFPGGASWTTPYTNGDRNLWAPDLS